MTQLVTKKDAELQQRHLQQISRACLEALERADQVARNVKTGKIEHRSRELAGTLSWVRQTPLVDRWIELECRIYDPVTSELKETKILRKRSRQFVKQAKPMSSSGRIVAPLNTMIVDVEGKPDGLKMFGEPQGHRMTKWGPEHGRLTAEERRAIKKRQKRYRQMSETIKSPVKSREKKLQELSSEIEELKRLIMSLG